MLNAALAGKTGELGTPPITGGGFLLAAACQFGELASKRSMAHNEERGMATKNKAAQGGSRIAFASQAGRSLKLVEWI